MNELSGPTVREHEDQERDGVESGKRLIRLANDQGLSLTERIANHFYRLTWRTPLHAMRLKGKYPLKLLAVPDDEIAGDARAGLQAAQTSARIAHAAAVGGHDPHGIEWRSHFIAAVCAKALGHGPAAKKSAECGIGCGGQKDIFEQFLK